MHGWNRREEAAAGSLGALMGLEGNRNTLSGPAGECGWMAGSQRLPRRVMGDSGPYQARRGAQEEKMDWARSPPY